MRIDGERLRAARERRLLTQAAVSEATGITEAALSRIEAGKQEPRISTVAAIVGYLGIEVDDILPAARPDRAGEGER